MRIARLTTDSGPSYATWTDDGWALIEDWTGGPPVPTGDVIAHDRARLLPPAIYHRRKHRFTWPTGVPLGVGDVVMIGAPNTAVPVKPTDIVKITIDGIGSLTSEVV